MECLFLKRFLYVEAVVKHLQFILEQHGFELNGSTSTWIFSINTCSIFEL